MAADTLERRLGLSGAVLVGLGSMLGTGVFVVFAPAAARAGAWLLLAVLLAGLVATCNGLSSAALAAQHPESGGTYAYGRHRLGPGWGALAGYAFVLGKTASCAAAALAVGSYAWPEHARVVAVAAVIGVVVVDYLGVATTALVTGVLVAVTLIALGWLVLASVIWDGPTAGPTPPVVGSGAPGPLAALAAAPLLFFAFAGYARITTLGEEVREPARTIPRAVMVALMIVLVVYLLVGAALWHVLGGDLASADAPVAAAAARATADGSVLTVVVRLAACAAALGALVSLLAGVSRTAFAMGRGGDLPAALARVHPRWRTPDRAVLLTGLVVLGVTLVGGIVGAVAFSAFTVLLYYAIANAAAWLLRPHERLAPRWVSALGFVGCLALAASLPWPTMLAGALALLVLLGLRAVVHRRRVGRADQASSNDRLDRPYQ